MTTQTNHTTSQLKEITRRFAYDQWANEEVLQYLLRSNPPPTQSAAIFSHILAAEWLWLNRMRSEDQHCEVWPKWSIEEAERELTELNYQCNRFLGGLTDDRLSETVTYTNSKGEPWSNTIDDILTHLVMHSAYHRGQIAFDMRAAGLEPAYTDFIHAVRQELIPI